jgi:diguanylate cyclase
MNTNKSLPESAEILRMALPLMSKFNIPVTPRNYAVWYEYAAGSNVVLNQKINHLINSGAPINNEFVSALYAEYIDTNHELNQLEKAQKIFAVLHESLTNVLNVAVGKTTEYGITLDQYNNRIKADLDLEQLQFLINDMAVSTKIMLKNNHELMEDLHKTRNEVTALQEQLHIAKKQAKTDTLTELANRKAFFDELDELEQKGVLKTGGHSLLMLDIDNFKTVNDSYGHLFGDKVIKTVAKVLKNNTKGKDLPARFGGEEFIAFLPDTNRAGALVVAEMIRKTIAGARIVNPRNNQVISTVTVSIGITEFMPGDNIETVIARADDALYCAKNAGRNQTAFADSSQLPIDRKPIAAGGFY